MQEYVVNRPEEEAMNRILAKNSDNAAGVILRLAWQAGLSRDEISALTWDQVSFLDSRLELPARMVPLEVDLFPQLPFPQPLGAGEHLPPCPSGPGPGGPDPCTADGSPA